jgi:hypothetical protein
MDFARFLAEQITAFFKQLCRYAAGSIKILRQRNKDIPAPVPK